MSLKILVLTHDVSDPATARRVTMLQVGGATVTVAGFRRSDQILEISGCPVIDFGRTRNGAFVQRVLMVLSSVLTLHDHQQLFDDADIVVARNLEMLAIAVRGRHLAAKRPSIVYEVLDIHRLLLRPDLLGIAMRSLEGWLSRRAAAVITSSPAFIESYFKRLSKVRLPIRLVENKILDLQGTLPPVPAERPSSPPWRIGWYGILRCHKSLMLLRNLVLQSRGAIEVSIRGRPALDAIPHFHEIVTTTPGLNYYGTYQNPADLAELYGSVHFTWAIDLYEEGQNSSWLLPNRLYEGCAYGAVPLAIAGLETSAFLHRLNIGVSIGNLETGLPRFFSALTVGHYKILADAVIKVPPETWISKQSDCKLMVDWLQSLNAHRSDS